MFPSSERIFGGGGGVGDGLGVADGDGDGDGVGDGVAVGEGEGLGDGQGVGAGDVSRLPSKLLGSVAPGNGVDDVAFELNTIQRPSVLIIGRLFAIRMRTFAPLPAEHTLKSTLWVSVI
jgi:hypothetical protein